MSRPRSNNLLQVLLQRGQVIVTARIAAAEQSEDY